MTDVEDLHEWIVKHLSEHPLFSRIPEADLVIIAYFEVYNRLSAMIYFLNN